MSSSIAPDINRDEFNQIPTDASSMPRAHTKQKLSKKLSGNSMIFKAIENDVRCCECWSALWLNPKAKYRKVWDVCMLLLVIYSSVWEPFSLAFSTNGNADFFGWLRKWGVDICFYADIFIQFVTAYDNGYELVTQKRRIAQKYMHGWFLPDMLSTIDWSMVWSFFTLESNVSKSVGLLRLIKIMRLVRASRLIAKLSAKWHTNTRFVEAAKFLVYVCVCAHLLACLFFMWPMFIECPKTEIQNVSGFEFDEKFHCPAEGPCDHTCVPGSWRSRYPPGDWSFSRGPKLDEDAASWVHPYVVSLYWALTTMTTIGYGDIVPKHQFEIVFVIVAEVVGLVVFALLLMVISDTYQMVGESKTIKDDIKNNIIAFMQAKHLNSDLITRVIAFLNFRRDSPSSRKFHGDDPLFAPLSHSLRKEIGIALGLPILEKVSLFGRNVLKDKEVLKLRTLFQSADTDNDGWMTTKEFEMLLNGLAIPGLQFEDCMADIKLQETEKYGKVVTLEKFEEWYGIKKHGRQRFPKSPLRFLHYIVECMEMVSYSPGDIIIEEGSYGQKMYIVMRGSVNVKRCQPEPEHNMQTDEFVETVKSSDPNPIFGLAAALDEPARKFVLQHTHGYRAWLPKADAILWEEEDEDYAPASEKPRFHQINDDQDDDDSDARMYCDLIEVDHLDLVHAFKEGWKGGTDEFETIAREIFYKDIDWDQLNKAGWRGTEAVTVDGRIKWRGDFEKPWTTVQHFDKLEGRMDQALTGKNGFVALHEKLDRLLG